MSLVQRVGREPYQCQDSSRMKWKLSEQMRPHMSPRHRDQQFTVVRKLRSSPFSLRRQWCCRGIALAENDELSTLTEAIAGRQQTSPWSTSLCEQQGTKHTHHPLVPHLTAAGSARLAILQRKLEKGTHVHMSRMSRRVGEQHGKDEASFDASPRLSCLAGFYANTMQVQETMLEVRSMAGAMTESSA